MFNPATYIFAYLLNVLALELGDELLKTLGVGLNANRAQDFLDVLSGRRGVSGQAEEEVSCQMLHFD